MADSNRPALTIEGCLARQGRLRERLATMALDAAVITDARDIYYFTGVWLDRAPACLMLPVDAPSWLALRDGVDAQGVEQAVRYEWHKLGTMNPDPMRQLTSAVAKHLQSRRAASRIGWQAESMPRQLAAVFNQAWGAAKWTAIDETVSELQSRKDADELALIRWSIRADLAAYDAARAAISPGVSELEVLAAAQRAATLAAGESVFHSGDYACGAMSGPARDRAIEQGELYIIDAWTIYRGYWCDLSRTFAVGAPTDLQRSVCEHIAAIQREAGALLKPGVRGTELWRWLDARINEHPALAGSGLTHHAGHGVGLRPHEAPDLNRDREGILEPGNVVAVEPGGYTDAARCGARIENMYLITEAGAELLSDHPMSL